MSATPFSLRPTPYRSVVGLGTIFRLAFIPLVAALPIALTAAPLGFVRVVGWMYLVLWCAIVVPQTAALLWLMLDAVLMILGRPPAFLAAMVAARRMNAYLTRRVFLWLDWYAKVAAAISPFSNLTLALMIGAIRLRPRLAFEALEQATKLEHALSQIVTSIEPSSELSGPVIDRVEAIERIQARELQLA